VQRGSLKFEITQWTKYVYFVLQLFNELFQWLFHYFLFVFCCVEMADNKDKQSRPVAYKKWMLRQTLLLKGGNVGTSMGREAHKQTFHKWLTLHQRSFLKKKTESYFVFVYHNENNFVFKNGNAKYSETFHHELLANNFDLLIITPEPCFPLKHRL